MKKINLSKKLKVILTIGTASIFIPVVAVSAVACSNNSNNNSSNSTNTNKSNNNSAPLNTTKFVEEFNNQKLNDVNSPSANYPNSFQEIMTNALENNLSNLNNQFDFNPVANQTNAFSQGIVPQIQQVLTSILKNNLNAFQAANLTQNDVNGLQVIAAIPFLNNNSPISGQVSGSIAANNLNVNVSLQPNLIVFLTFKNLTTTYSLDGENITIPKIIPITLTGFKSVQIISQAITLKDITHIESAFSQIQAKFENLSNSFLNILKTVNNTNTNSVTSKIVDTLDTNNLNKINSQISSDLNIDNLENNISLQPSNNSNTTYTQKISEDFTTYLQQTISTNKAFSNLNLSSTNINNLKVYYSAILPFNLNDINKEIINSLPTFINSSSNSSFSPSIYSFVTDGGPAVSLSLNGVNFKVPPTQIITWSNLPVYSSTENAAQQIQAANINSLSPFVVNASNFVSSVQQTIATLPEQIQNMVKNISKKIMPAFKVL